MVTIRRSRGLHWLPRAALVPCALLAAVAALALAACDAPLAPTATTRGSGNLKTESRAVSGFDAVRFDGVGELDILQSGSESLQITAEDNLLPLLTSDVQGSQLTIGVKAGQSIQPTRALHFLLTVKDLRSLSLSGASDVNVAALKAQDFTARLSGAGALNVAQLTGETLHVATSGTGNVIIAGSVTSQEVTLSGSGSYSGENLASKSATVTVSGAGKATVQVSQTLDATVSGAGVIEYIGNPTVTKKISGVGSVKKR